MLATPEFEAQTTELQQSLASVLEEPDLLQSRPCRRICELLVLGGCNEIRVEPEYYCRDFMSEYAFLYSRVIEDIPRFTRRAHCFSDTEYLGFTVIRPLMRRYKERAVGRIGRSVLSCVADGEGHHVLAKHDYPVHIGTAEHRITGVPFCEQDTQVMCCAHASIWMANRILSSTEPTVRDFYPHEIAQFGTSKLPLGATVPTGGLHSHQMLACVAEMGMEPLYVDVDAQDRAEPEHLDGFIYRYVESGIPVILLMAGAQPWGHALVAVGHDFDPTAVPAADAPNAPYYAPTNWIRRFIVHDDSYGPYMLLPRHDEREQLAQEQAEAAPRLVGRHPGYTLNDLVGLIVPVPRNVLLSGEAAETRAWAAICEYGAKQHFPGLFAQTDSAGRWAVRYGGKKLVLRTYLERSHLFKARYQALANDPRVGEGTRQAALLYGDLFLGRHVWITEISTTDHFAAPCRGNRRMIGEVVCDATSSEYGKPELAIHLPGTLFLSDPRQPWTTDRFELPDEAPYWHRGAHTMPRREAPDEADSPES